MKKHLISLFICLSLNSFASDHIDGPVTKSHAVSDITDLYAFPSPEHKGFLTIILNTYPLVPSNGHFSDKVDYEIFIREATVGSSVLTKKGMKIVCKFKTPYDHDKHTIDCSGIGKLAVKATARVNNVAVSEKTSPFFIFAGIRSDPFFFNADWAKKAGDEGVLLPENKENTMDKLNVLSIVMDIDLKTVLGSTGSLFAVAAQTMTEGKRLDRIGRPEITNVTLNARDREDIRDEYNLESAFNTSEVSLKKFKTRISRNINFYDNADKKIDWNPGPRDALVSLLADDFLVVDLAKPCPRGSFLEIEMALVSGKSHQTCGGRHPEDDIMDILFTYYINANNGNRISDGVSEPYKKIDGKFPYLAPADTSLLARLKALIARKFFSL